MCGCIRTLAEHWTRCTCYASFGAQKIGTVSARGGRPGPVLVCDTPQPPPPRVLKDSGAGSATSKWP